MTSKNNTQCVLGTVYIYIYITIINHSGDMSLSFKALERSLLNIGESRVLKMMKNNGSSITKTFLARNDMHSSIEIKNKQYEIIKTYTFFKVILKY